MFPKLFIKQQLKNTLSPFLKSRFLRFFLCSIILNCFCATGLGTVGPTKTEEFSEKF